MVGVALGERAPQVVGATASGGFYSLEIQAGRPAVLLFLHGCGPVAARGLLDALEPVLPALAEAGVDLVPLAPQDLAYAHAFDGGQALRDAGGLILGVALAHGGHRRPGGPGGGSRVWPAVVHSATVYGGAEDLLQAHALAAA